MSGSLKKDAKLWTRLALDDLASSRILYDKGQYRNAYFLFQQATEKANKAFGLWAGIIKPEEVKGIGHNHFKIVQTYLRGRISALNEKIKVPSADERKIKEKHQGLVESLAEIEKLKDENLINIPSAELLDVYTELYALSLPLSGRFPGFKQLKNNKNVPKIGYVFWEQILTWWIDFSFISFTLLGCAVITVQHSTLPRYPENGKNPETIYTKRLALIKHQPLFMDLLEKALRRLQSIKNQAQIFDKIKQPPIP